MFDQKEHDPKLYQEVADNFLAGKKYEIVKWKWGYTADKKSVKETIKTFSCPTIKDFNRELWDLFAEFAKDNSYNIIWGAFGLEARNPEKPSTQYYDGLIFYLMEKEFKECIKNQDISHFMSCLVHYGYFNLDFNVIN